MESEVPAFFVIRHTEQHANPGPLHLSGGHKDEAKGLPHLPRDACTRRGFNKFRGRGCVFLYEKSLYVDALAVRRARAPGRRQRKQVDTATERRRSAVVRCRILARLAASKTASWTGTSRWRTSGHRAKLVRTIWRLDEQQVAREQRTKMWTGSNVACTAARRGSCTGAKLTAQHRSLQHSRSPRSCRPPPAARRSYRFPSGWTGSESRPRDREPQDVSYRVLAGMRRYPSRAWRCLTLRNVDAACWDARGTTSPNRREVSRTGRGRRACPALTGTRPPSRAARP